MDKKRTKKPQNANKTYEILYELKLSSFMLNDKMSGPKIHASNFYIKDKGEEEKNNCESDRKEDAKMDVSETVQKGDESDEKEGVKKDVPESVQKGDESDEKEEAKMDASENMLKSYEDGFKYKFFPKKHLLSRSGKIVVCNFNDREKIDVDLLKKFLENSQSYWSIKKIYRDLFFTAFDEGNNIITDDFFRDDWWAYAFDLLMARNKSSNMYSLMVSQKNALAHEFTIKNREVPLTIKEFYMLIALICTLFFHTRKTGFFLMLMWNSMVGNYTSEKRSTLLKSIIDEMTKKHYTFNFKNSNNEIFQMFLSNLNSQLFRYKTISKLFLKSWWEVFLIELEDTLTAIMTFGSAQDARKTWSLFSGSRPAQPDDSQQTGTAEISSNSDNVGRTSKVLYTAYAFKHDPDAAKYSFNSCFPELSIQNIRTYLKSPPDELKNVDFWEYAISQCTIIFNKEHLLLERCAEMISNKEKMTKEYREKLIVSFNALYPGEKQLTDKFIAFFRLLVYLSYLSYGLQIVIQLWRYFHINNCLKDVTLDVNRFLSMLTKPKIRKDQGCWKLLKVLKREIENPSGCNQYKMMRNVITERVWNEFEKLIDLNSLKL